VKSGSRGRTWSTIRSALSARSMASKCDVDADVVARLCLLLSRKCEGPVSSRRVSVSVALDGGWQSATMTDDASPEDFGLIADLEQQLLDRMRAMSTSGTPEDGLALLRDVRDEFTRLRLYYSFGIQEVSTKIDILRQEFENMYDYSPIEHVRSRLKTPDSLLAKALRQGTSFTVPAIRAQIRDIAGIRITCSFVSDAYWIARMLSAQPDLTVLTTKDYIANPKPNGYRSLHLIVEVPVFLSTHTEQVPVELQIRTIAMDFWASMEHKLTYKYRTDMPPHVAAEIADAARAAADLDARMGRLRDEIRPSPFGPPDQPWLSA
jgi:putative GTP pyrophosphokinase